MGIKQPRWKVPEYTKKQINNAGVIIKNHPKDSEEYKGALKVIDNWRSAHAYPMHVFYMNLRDKANSRSDVIVVERIKRMESIIAKLERFDNMNLYRMQDLGGCRMILPTLEEVYKYSDMFRNSKIRHEFLREYDYIKKPKKSGYRSLHLIYRFRSDTNGKEVYNDYLMQIELQFRTHLQHIWATALETIGLFTNQALKAGNGNEEILRFFVLVSSLFAIREECPVIPGTVNDERKLVSEIKYIDREHHVLEMLKAIRADIEHKEKNISYKKGYYILILNYEDHILKSRFFMPSELEEANMIYDFLEYSDRNKPVDIVMVRADSYDKVKAAYPNYFMDIGEFVDIVQTYLK